VTPTSPPPAGLRARKKADTRQALAAAALRLATEVGPDHVTVDDIAAAAGVSPRTFFNYFSSKEDALVGVDPDRRAELLGRLLDRPADEAPLDALRHAVIGGAETFEQRAEEWSARMRLVREHDSLVPRYAASFHDVEQVLILAIADRLGLDPEIDVYPALVVGVALTAMRVALKQWDATGHATPLVERIDAAFDAIAQGLPRP